MTTNTVPKKIWMLWLQGLEKAPDVVKQCYRSWETLNPGWEIVFLDETNLHQYVDVAPVLAAQNTLEMQALSDVLRINLLTQYGGVWVDATCYCQVPLDNWLNDYTSSGFFAFCNTKEDRLLDSWFLVSSQNSYLMTKWAEVVNTYLLANPQLARRHEIARYFKWLLTANTYTTRYWFSYLVRRLLKVYPYHWMTYLFTELIRRDRQSRQLWEQTKKIDVEVTLSLYLSGLMSPVTEQIKEEVDSRRVPVYKLAWKEQGLYKHLRKSERGAKISQPASKLDEEDKPGQLAGTVLGYLFESGHTGTR